MIFSIPLPKVPEGYDMKIKGSMTVFAALTFMLIASFLFALLEAGRVHILREYVDMTSELAVESVFAEYQPALWKQYHLLGLDGAYGGVDFSEEYCTGVLGARVRDNLVQQGDGGRMMEAVLVSAMPETYQFMTDGEGRVFLHSVAGYMEHSLPMEIMRELYEHYTDEQSVQEDYRIGDSIENATQAITDAHMQQTENTNSRAVSEEQILENPVQDVLAWKDSFVLASVIEDADALSIKGIDGSACIGNRVLQTGTEESTPDIGWYEKILATEYAEDYLSSYVSPLEERALAYELEYVIAGKETDRENLEAVVERLLLMREAANVMHILSDAEKRLMTEEMAVALVGFTANPAIINVVKYGVIGAWAYVESILDVRALLAGKAIAFVKTAEQWTSTLSGMSQFLTGSVQADNCEDGWNYQQYLKGFLYVLTEKNLAYRMMDVMEQNIRSIYAYRNFRMDYTLGAVTFGLTYEAEPLFWDFSVLDVAELNALRYQNYQSFSYY